MKQLVAILIIALSFGASAQDKALYLKFPPLVDGMDYTLNSVVQDLSGNYMQIQDFNYYLSNIHIIHDGGQDLDLSDTIILVKAAEHEFLMGYFDITNIESISFGVGVPQAINHLDISQYPTGHFLSFQSPSMHWGWTSGYKLLLCDGQGDSNGDGTPETIFQLHNIGDANYQNYSMSVIGTNYTSHIDLIINCNMDEWIYGVNPATLGVMHGETGINASTMDNVNNRPVFTQSASAGMNEMTEHGKMYFISHETSIDVVWEDLTGIAQFKLVDMSGRVIDAGTSSDVNSTHTITNLNSGQYLFTVYDEDDRVINSIKVVL
ncbi:MAG: hypothetical protein QNK23_11020 [Crocinitomicaceae bacterium]|nr:hypothetical protein [Crocinitomicaceae bacterium]